MDFARMPEDWPMKAQARRIDCRPHQWCVVEAGHGPDLLMLHGAGGSGHSLAPLVPYLAPHFRVLIPDLPGQGFTRSGARGRHGLDPTAEDLAALCAAQGWKPAVTLGHSAGAAVALRLADHLPERPRAIVGINAALGSFEGAAGVMFPLLARILAVTPFIPHVVARLWGNAATVDKLLTGTGSALGDAARGQYLRLVQDAAHVDGTLAMMAQWRLDGLMARLPSLPVPVLLVASAGDKAVPAAVSRDAARHMPTSTYAEIAALGHLVHEEDPAQVAGLILRWLKEKAGF